MASPGNYQVDPAAALVLKPVEAADWLLVAPVLLPLMAGAVLLMARRQTGVQAAGAISVLVMLVAISIGLLLRVIDTGPLTMTMGKWLPPFGISFTVDTMSAALVLTASIVALACGVFAAGETEPARLRYGFYPFFMLMMAGVNGAFLTGDIFNLYVWFEVLLISSFGLIVLGGEKAQLEGTLKYAFLNLVATTLFLIATGYLYGVFGTLNMADITRKVPTLPDNAPIFTIACLYLFAFAMKAAAFPLNFWLPASYHTPRLVVAALFAGLLTKVGVYALLRVLVMIFAAQRDLLAFWIAIVAALTMVLGVLGALAQSDVRRLLGFLVVSGIGSMLAGIAISGQLGLTGALVYAVHSMIVMSALYLAVAIMMRTSGEFDLRRLGGHYSAMPWFSAGFLVLAFAVSGMPPFSGFWPKIMIVKGALSGSAGWLAACILLTGLLTSIAIIRVWAHAFWRGGPQGVRDGAESWKIEPLAGAAAAKAYLPLVLLIAVSLWLGLMPESVSSVMSDAARSLQNPQAYIGSVFGGVQ
ncbi:MAG: Na+/H+ antiporter subunit D [Rhizobiaceae bacterium]